MNKLSVLGALLVVLGIGTVEAAKKGFSVTLVSQSQFKLAGCVDNNDPLGGRCDAERLVLENRSFTPMSVTLNCGTDLDESETLIPARTRLTVDVTMTLPSKFPACKISKVSPAK